MISRIIVLLIFLLVGSAGAYYFLRQTPQSQVTRLREQVSEYVERGDRLDLAEQLVDQVLELIPNSAFDLVTKANIRERRGSPDDMKEALRIYDQILATNDPSVLGVAFLKARVCRQLGMIAQANGTLLSVMDLFPFAALLELGETALAGLSPIEARKYFTRAKDAATTRLDTARAQEGIANALFLARALTPDAPAGELEGEARKALLEALSFIKSDDLPTSSDEANRRLTWAALVIDRLASIGEANNATLTEGLVLLDGRRKDYGILGKESSLFLIRLGALRLLALRDEKPTDAGVARAVEKAAERDFAQALRLTPSQAREVVAALVNEEAAGLAKVTRVEGKPTQRSVTPANEYVQNLLAVTRAHLNSAHFSRVLDDPSSLALSQRIADVTEVGHSGVAGLFTLLRGFARWKSGDPVEGEKLVDAYLASLSTDVRTRGVVESAEQALTLFPAEPVCFRILDKFDANGGGTFTFIGRRVSILLSARMRAPLAAEAHRRLSELLQRMTGEARSPAEHLGAAKVIYSIEGKQPAIGLLRQAAERFPGDPGVQHVYADLEFEHGMDAALGRAERDTAFRNALASYVYLFVRSPGDSQEVIRRCVETLRQLKDSQNGEDAAGLESALRRLFPTVSVPAMDPFVGAVQLFLRAQFGPALERSRAIDGAEAEKLRPFLSFLRGNCHVGLARFLQNDLATVSSDAARQDLQGQYKDHLQKAMEEFRRETSSVACELELANLEYQTLGPKDDVPDELFKRIQSISDAEGHDHAGYFLLAQVCRHRFAYRYRQRSVKNSELLRWVVREQRALRAAIRKSSTFNPAYLALAETFLVTDRTHRGDGESGNRQLFTPSPEKAISVLKGAPAPNEAIYSKLAQCYELIGKIDLAAGYLEQLVAIRPNTEGFSKLLSVYLRSNYPGSRVLLAAEINAELEAALPPPVKDRLPMLLAMRKSFEQLPEHEGLRHMFLAMQEEGLMNGAATETAKKRSRETMIGEYTKAVQAFEAKGLVVPLVILNNLAWHLSEDQDRERKARAVDLADRARKMVPNIMANPDAHDTYAWVLHRIDRNSEAESILRDVLSVADRPSYRYHLAKVLLALSKFDDALKEVQVARDFPRQFPESDAARELEYEIREARRQAIGE